MSKPISLDEVHKLMSVKKDSAINYVNEKIAAAAKANYDCIYLDAERFDMVRHVFAAAGYTCNPGSTEQMAMISWA